MYQVSCLSRLYRSVLVSGNLHHLCIIAVSYDSASAAIGSDAALRRVVRPAPEAACRGLALCVRTGKGGDRLDDRTEAGG